MPPQNGTGRTVSTIHRIRTSVTSKPKYRAKPAQTPPSLPSCMGRDSRSTLGVGADEPLPVGFPHSLQNLSRSFSSIPHLVQNIAVTSLIYDKRIHRAICSVNWDRARDLRNENRAATGRERHRDLRTSVTLS